jgi:ligand-binding sensor domain-containing protein
MHRIALAIPLLALVLAAAPAVAADGAWTVFIRPTGYRDVLAQRETVWVSTKEAGLLRFLRSSGRFESVFRTPGGLASNDLTVLASDRSGRLWVGTNGRGAGRLSADGLAWSLVNAFDGLPSDTVTVIEPEGDTLWIGTTRGLALWNGREVSGAVPDGVNPSPFASNAITGVVVSGDTVLVGTSAGVYFGRKSEQLANWTEANTGLIATNCSGLASDGRDVFALANGGTHRWNRATATWSVAAGNGSVRQIRDGFGRIVSISTLGMYVWSGSAWDAVAGSPPSTSSSGDGGVPPALDPDGVAVAAPSAGLQIGPGFELRTPPGPVGNDVSHVVSSRGALYVGTQDRGLSRLRDGVWKSWTSACDRCTTVADTGFKLPLFVYGLHADGRGIQWVGSWGGSVARLHDRGVVDTVDNRPVVDGVYDPSRHTYVWSSATDRFGRTWLGLDTPDRGGLPPIGIDVYDSTGAWMRSFQPGTDTYGQPGLNNGQIRALEVDKNDRLWVGYASAGLDRASLSASITGPLVLSDVSSTVGTLDVFGIRANGDSLWILASDGLRRISVSSLSITGSTPTYSLPGSVAPRGAVHPLEVDADGSVWVGTTLGVRHYFLRPNRTLGTEDFNVDNSPLPSNEVRSVRRDPDTGVLWFATERGVAGYDPRYRAPAEPVLPRLHVLVYPNPVQTTGIGFQLRLRGDAQTYGGSIHDITGRLVRRFENLSNGALFWNGRDDEGVLVRPGLYFVRVKGGGAEATARLAVVR